MTTTDLLLIVARVPAEPTAERAFFEARLAMTRSLREAGDLEWLARAAENAYFWEAIRARRNAPRKH